MGSLITELLAYARAHRKLILLPLVLLMLVMALLLVFAEGSVLAPFIYTVF